MVGLVLWVLALLVYAWLYPYPQTRGFATDELTLGAFKAAAGCLLFFVADPQHAAARFLSAPWLRWCGIISYEWYLFHRPLILWARESSGPAGGNLLK